MEDADEDLRIAIYRSFVATGRAPSIVHLASETSSSELEVVAALRRLHEARHIVLGDDGDIRMAHPFSSIPLGFSVMGSEALWWGGCAWDAFAIPHLVDGEGDVLVATQCPGCGKPHAWVVNDAAAPVGDQIAHFLVPTARIWDDVVHACRNQRIFCGLDCVERWSRSERTEPGYVMDLATLWRLAAGWYSGRLQHGYRRREPRLAHDYFRDVGLSGSFWGLEGS